MDNDRRIIHICTAVLLGVVILRLISGPAGAAVKNADMSDVASALLFLQTGRVVKLANNTDQQEQTPTQPQPEQPQAAAPAVFTAEDISRVSCNSANAIDVEQLLKVPLQWELTGDAATVLILHTHATESYTRTEEYAESSEYRTLDEGFNMVSVGEHLAKCLESSGIGVIHDRQLHDYPSYNGAYEQSRKTMQEHLQQTPSAALVLDLHRDAMVDSMGNQIGYTVETDAGEAAKVMLVVGQWNDNWQENMALAVKLHARLEQICPGICRPISIRGSRFNQDLSPGALLIEVGAAGNTRQEALRATEILAEAITSLSNGAVYEDG